MYAERFMLEADMTGKLNRVTKLSPNKKLEAIFVAVSEGAVFSKAFRRVPHPDIAGNVI